MTEPTVLDDFESTNFSKHTLKALAFSVEHDFKGQAHDIRIGLKWHYWVGFRQETVRQLSTFLYNSIFIIKLN
jgi:hypothetical protein